MRKSEINRKTGETDVRIELNLDGNGTYDISTGVGFLDHMLELFARHGRFDLTVRCQGDTQVDDHHSTEDIGIALGMAFDKALGDKKGICRYGSMLLPMDEALIQSAVDLSGRGMLVYDMDVPAARCTFMSWKGGTAIIFWKAPSRAWPAACGRRSGLIRRQRRKYPPRREYCNGCNHRLRGGEPVFPAIFFRSYR